MKRLTVLLALGWALLLGGALSQDGVQDLRIDDTFIVAAAQGDLYEITSSQLAVERAADASVRDFAQRMIADHTMTTERLAELASAVGAVLPSSPAPTHQVKLAHLVQLEGDEFDRAYIEQQVIAHQDAVSLFRTAAVHAENEQLRSFAETTLPALLEHLLMAQDLMSRLR